MNFAINFADAAVQASIVGAAGAVLASLIAAICAAIISREIVDRKRLLDKLQTATKDIEFLLAVEQFHCSQHQATQGQSLKLTIRRRAREAGQRWSGNFTPGRL